MSHPPVNGDTPPLGLLRFRHDQFKDTDFETRLGLAAIDIVRQGEGTQHIQYSCRKRRMTHLLAHVRRRGAKASKVARVHVPAKARAASTGSSIAVYLSVAETRSLAGFIQIDLFFEFPLPCRAQ